MADRKVRCRRCRLVLLSADEYSVLNAHGTDLGIGINDLVTGDSQACSSMVDSSLIYLREDPLPDFLQESLTKGVWVKGKIHCPKCNSRLGSFNFIADAHCSCGEQEVPPIRLQTSKVDYIRPNERVVVAISHPDQPISQTEDLLSVLEATNSLPDMLLHDLEIGELPVHERAFDPDENPPSCNSSPGTASSSSHSGPSATGLPTSLSGSPGGLPSSGERLRRRKRRSSRNSSPPFCSEGAAAPDCEDFVAPSSRFHVLECGDVPETDSDSTSDECQLIPDEFVCPICLDLLYSPMVTKPCGHVFCEPCLRRVGQPTPNNTLCPLCRKLIGMCHSFPEMSKKVKVKFPDQLDNRWKFEKNKNTQNLPLPYTKKYRYFGLQARVPTNDTVWHCWKTLVWILALDALGLAVILLVKWFFNHYNIKINPMLQSERDSDVMERDGDVTDRDAAVVLTLKHLIEEWLGIPMFLF